ncbi:hypothetical protein [Rhizobium leguminosarum]|uniref:hypothetical protein n=1 Tax=Rhizobium leguminosarum TaxID=384 RepID=UPI0002E2017E|nr:hypothetical protein [Rhizobium leguminosarum]
MTLPATPPTMPPTAAPTGPPTIAPVGGSYYFDIRLFSSLDAVDSAAETNRKIEEVFQMSDFMPGPIRPWS